VCVVLLGCGATTAGGGAAGACGDSVSSTSPAAARVTELHERAMQIAMLELTAFERADVSAR
jgi:hypothetical protein